MVIDGWNGWVWACFNCDALGRKATDQEIEKQENEYNQLFIGSHNGQTKTP